MYFFTIMSGILKSLHSEDNKYNQKHTQTSYYYYRYTAHTATTAAI